MTDTPNRFTITVGKQGPAVSRADAKKRASSDGGKSEPSAPNSALDLVFVIDSTGSMSGKIKALMSMCERFVDNLTKNGISYRAAIVAFGDLTVPGDKISATPFTANVHTGLLQVVGKNANSAHLLMFCSPVESNQIASPDATSLM